MVCEHGNGSSLCADCALPEHYKLGRKMAQALRDLYGDEAESKLEECQQRARASGERLQIDTVRMAEKFLIGRKPSRAST